MAPHDPHLDALVEQVRAARAARTPLAITGGGSKRFYGEPADADAPPTQTLDVTGLRGISAYEPSELVVTVRAGTPLAELQAALATQGQWLPFEPPHFDTPGSRGATVGGMVAAGLAGPGRPAAGSVRDHLLGATLLDGRAELLSFGGQVMKNVAGYDVSRLLAGSLGVLGVICEVSLKVLPRPVAQRTLRFELDEAEALKRLNTWGGQPLPITASAWWDGMLVLRLAGAEAAVGSASRSLGGEPVADELAEGFWSDLRDQRDEFFGNGGARLKAGATLWRLSLPDTAPATALPGEHLVEWGGAQRWVFSDAPADTLRALAASLGGHAVAFRGGQRGGAFAPLPAPLRAVHQRLKAEFDPEGIFNPGRLIPGL